MALQEPADVEELSFSGEGIQDNECNQWLCRTKVFGEAVPKDGVEWYPAQVRTSQKLSCDVRHLHTVDTNSKSSDVEVNVKLMRRPIDAPKSEAVEEQRFSWQVILNRSVPALPLRSMSCARRDGGRNG